MGSYKLGGWTGLDKQRGNSVFEGWYLIAVSCIGVAV